MKNNLRQIINENLEKGTAVGHFNFSTFDVAQAIVNAAKNLNLPVILGLSEGERDFAGFQEAVAWVKAIRENFYAPVFLNADHTYSYERIVEAVEAGFDMVIYDDAAGDLDKNIEEAKKCREFINNFNQKNGTDVLLEAEIGYIGKSSKILDVLPDGLQMTSKEDALKFVSEVHPDLLAPAVGNVHGMLKGAVKDPDLDTNRVKEISETVKIPLVLHGASGNGKDEIQTSIKNGVAVVHVNTEIRVAYKNALEKIALEKEVAPYKYMKAVEDDVQKVVEEKLKIFNFLE